MKQAAQIFPDLALVGEGESQLHEPVFRQCFESAQRNIGRRVLTAANDEFEELVFSQQMQLLGKLVRSVLLEESFRGQLLGC